MTKVKVIRVILSIILASLTLGLVITGCSGGSSGGSSTTAIVGKKAPDFTLQDLDGQSVSLSDFEGKPVLINFWNSGCSPCRREMPFLQEIYDEIPDSELVMLTINIGESSATVKKFLGDNNLSLPVLLDTNAAVAQRYSMPGIPTTFFVDRDGILQVKVIGAFPNKAAIESRLSEIMP